MRTYRLPLSCYWFSHSNAHRSLFHAHGVQILTQEDAWAVRLLDTIACLRQLLKTGLTREVYVFGNMQVQPVLAFAKVLCCQQMFRMPYRCALQSGVPERCKRSMQGQWVKGIVDQLELDDHGRVRVVEHKTRRRESLPLQAQQQTAHLQAWCCSCSCCCCCSTSA